MICNKLNIGYISISYRLFCLKKRFLFLQYIFLQYLCQYKKYNYLNLFIFIIFLKSAIPKKILLKKRNIFLKRDNSRGNMMKYLPKIHKRCHFFKADEIGRSMIEMLGALAIAGILSIGGIMGYTYAMDRYRANDIINEVNMRGRDTWNRYQNKTLPDEINDWSTETSSGFPIEIITNPEEGIFFIEVREVPSRICKMVLQGQFDSVYALIVQSEDVGGIYTGDTSICDSLESNNVTGMFAFDIRNDYETKPGGTGMGLCITDSDCGRACLVCEREKHLCRNTCTGTKGKCGVDGRCVQCETNDDCSEGICNEATFLCEAPPAQCKENEFRSRNGACIPCSHPSNVLIDRTGHFAAGEPNGAELCHRCTVAGTQRVQETLNQDTPDEKAYCSYSCTMGISYQALNGECIPCDDMSTHGIASDNESKALCLACPNHIWHNGTNNLHYCRGPLNCAVDEFAAEVQYTGIQCIECAKSDVKRMFPSGFTASDSNLKQTMINTCNSCPSTDEAGNWAKRYIYTDGTKSEAPSCFLECQQSSTGRKWQNANGNCLDCDYTGNATSIDVANTELYNHLKNLCGLCNRTVTEEKYCVRQNVTCDVGYFKGSNGYCYKCSRDDPAEVSSEAESGCSASCMQNNEKEYDKSGSITTRWIFEKSGKKYCAKKCAGEKKEFQDSSGDCYSCTEETSPALNGSTELKDLCLSCADRIVFNGNCAPETCPDKDNVKQFRSSDGQCVSCNTTNAPYIGASRDDDNFAALKQGCENCGNRVAFPITTWSNGYRCGLINPGENGTGVCNSVESTLSEQITADYRNIAAPYINGNYDGIYFRDNNGICRSCNAKESYSTTSAQCKSCGNRKFNRNCSYGLCSPTKFYLNTSGNCIDCPVPGSGSVLIMNGAGSEDLCNSCDGYRALTIGNPEKGNLKTYCVSQCFGEQFQGIDGQCYDEDSEDMRVEIGTDNVSKTLCDSFSNRTVVTDEESGKVYCQIQ